VVTVLGGGAQLVQPVYLGDVAEAVARAVEGAPAGTYDLAGPDAMTLDDLVRLLNRGGDVRLRHVPAPLARALAWFWRGLPPALVDLLLRDRVGEPERATAALGLRLTHLGDIWS
jgi:NAD(P)H dehydrogenase (quinone)